MPPEQTLRRCVGRVFLGELRARRNVPWQGEMRLRAWERRVDCADNRRASRFGKKRRDREGEGIDGSVGPSLARARVMTEPSAWEPSDGCEGRPASVPRVSLAVVGMAWPKVAVVRQGGPCVVNTSGWISKIRCNPRVESPMTTAVLFLADLKEVSRRFGGFSNALGRRAGGGLPSLSCLLTGPWLRLFAPFVPSDVTVLPAHREGNAEKGGLRPHTFRRLQAATPGRCVCGCGV